jgi:phosphatidate cytidylyltransferase
MLRQRILTAVIALAALGVVLFILPETAARFVIATVFLAGAWEWGGFVFKDGGVGPRLIYVAFIGALIALLFFYLGDETSMELLYQVAIAWWFVALVWMFFFPTPIAQTLIWIAGMFVLLPAWAALDFLYLESPTLLLFALLIVWVADIGAYFVGKGFGRVKLAPKISPGKSWEGVLGGLTAVTLLAAVGSRVFDIGISVLVPFCLAVSMLSVVGDLTVSMFKRNAEVKDSGSLFPGHGGVLDRIDSVTAAAPLFALAISWIGLR